MATKHPLIGKTVKDKVTGTRGTVTGIFIPMTGSDRAQVEYKTSTGAANVDWFDLERIEEVEAPTAERPFPGSGDPGDPGPGAPDISPAREATE